MPTSVPTAFGGSPSTPPPTPPLRSSPSPGESSTLSGESSRGPSDLDSHLLVEYEDWVNDNHSELNPAGALFEFLEQTIITPETASVHVQLIAGWVAQR